MSRLFAVCAVAGSLLLASPAAAATRYVDDDRAQCPQAAHTTIGAAISAAAPGDLVQVCAGRYAEQVVLPASKPGLFLNSPATRAAHIVAPAAGLVSHTYPDESRARVDLVRLDGARQHLEGFSVDGPLRPKVPAEGCLSSAAVVLDGDDAVVADVGVAGLADSPCTTGAEPNVGVRISGWRDIVNRSAVTGAKIAIALSAGFDALVQLNTIRGRGSASFTTGFSASLLGLDADFAGGSGTIRNNEIAAAGVGMALEYWGGLVLTNNVHDNGTGVIVGDNAGGEIRSNVISHNTGDGLLAPQIGSHSLGRSGLIRLNQVRDNGRDGIAVFGCALGCFPASSSFRLDRNTALGNGRWDCFDDGVGDDTWTSNIGVKDSPNVCAKP